MGLILHQRHPPAERTHCIQGRAKATGSPTFCHQLRWALPRIQFPCVLITQEKYRRFNSLTSNKEWKTSHQLSWEWALINLSLSSKLANQCLCTLWCRSCQEKYRQPFSGACRSQTISQPASQTVFITRTQHLNETFYLSKYVMFSQQRWTEVSGVSVSSLLPRLICKHSTYWRGSKKTKKLFWGCLTIYPNTL